MKKISVVLLGLLLVAGCATSPQANSEFSSDDIDFAQKMIPHHEQAIEMSDIALLNSANPEILGVAQEIKNAQSPEIEQMLSWTGVKASTHSGHMMDGMLSEAELVALREARGEEFDRLFLQGMIKHHEGAIAMAQAVADSKNQEVANLSASIIAAQESEIVTMKELLAQFD